MITINNFASLFVIVLILTFYESQLRDALASPPFLRQEIPDKENDHIIIKTGLPASAVPPEVADLTDIEMVSYFSDGNILNATLWLDRSFVKTPVRNDMISYGILIDVDSNKETGWKGIEYMTEIIWENKTRTWYNMLEEWSHSSSREVSKTNYTAFVPEGSYVDLSLDLKSIGSPNEYKVAFFTQQSVRNGTSTYVIGDFTDGFHIPAPDLILLPSSNPVVLDQGARKTIDLNIEATKSLPEVYLESETIDGINVDITPSNLSVPSGGMSRVSLDIWVDPKLDPGTRTLRISVDGTFPPEPPAEPSNTFDDDLVLPFNVPPLPSKNVTKYLDLIIEIEMVPWYKPVRDFFETWEVLIGLGLGGLTFAFGEWLFGRIRHTNEKK